MIKLHVYRAIFPKLTAVPESVSPTETFEIFKNDKVVAAGITAENPDKPYEVGNEVGETFSGARRGDVEIVLIPCPPLSLQAKLKNGAKLECLTNKQIEFLKKRYSSFEIGPYDEDYPDEAYPETGSV